MEKNNQQGAQNQQALKSHFKDFFKRNAFNSASGNSLLTEFKTQVDQVIDHMVGDVPDISIKAFSFDYRDDGIFTAVIVTIQKQEANELFYHIIHLPAQAPNSVMLFNQNQKPLVSRQAIDLLQRELTDDIRRYIYEKVLDNKNAEVFYCGETYIPWEVDFCNQGTVHALFSKSLSEISSQMNRRDKEYTPINLVEFSRENRFDVEIDFNCQENVTNYYGATIRSNVKVSVYETSVRVNQPVYNSNTPIGTLYGYFDLVWDGKDEVKKYIPRFIVTSIQSDGYDDSTVFILLSTLQKFNTEYTWINGFINHKNKKGDLNVKKLLEGNKHLSKEFEQVDENNLFEFMRKACHENVIVSLDYPSLASTTEDLLAKLLALKNGNDEAYRDLVSSLSDLTNGFFDQYFDHNTPMSLAGVLFSTNEIVAIGAVNSDFSHDLRNFDFLRASENFDSKEMDEYINIHSPTGKLHNGEGINMMFTSSHRYSPDNRPGITFNSIVDKRMEMHMRVATRFMPATFKLSLYEIGERISLRPEFVKALYQAVEACGVRFKYTLVNNFKVTPRVDSGFI